MKFLAVTLFALYSFSAVAIEREIDLSFESPLLATRGSTQISFMDLHGRMQAIPAGDRAGVVSSPERLESLIQDVLLVHYLANLGREQGIDQTEDFVAELNHMLTVRLAEKYREDFIEDNLLDSYTNQARETFVLNRDRFVRPDTVSFRHILVREFRDDPQGKAQALLDQAAAGADFAELARAHSDDPSVVQNDGTLSDVDVGTLDTGFAEGLSGLAEGATGLVQSQFGWHVVQLVDRAEGGPQRFEEVQDELERQARARHREQLYDRLMREAFAGELELTEGAVAEILDRYPPPQELIDAISEDGR